jgi:hypothetical protein
MASGTQFGFRYNDNREEYISGVTNKWYNIRVEITYSASGSSAQVYIDNVKKGSAKAITADASSVTGLYFQGRPAAGPNANSLFDNFVIDNTSTSKTSSYYGQYNAGQLSENTVVADFNGTNAGVGDYLFSPTSKFDNINKRPAGDFINHAYTLIEDGAWVLGTGSSQQTAYDRIKLGFNDIAVGSKIVIEYDYKFVKIGERTGSSGASLRTGFISENKEYASPSHEMWINYKTYINPDNNNNGMGVFYFTAGQWNKLRIEVVTAENSYTVTYFVDNVQKYTETFNTALTSVDCFAFTMANYEYQEHHIDNFVATVIPPVAE